MTVCGNRLPAQSHRAQQGLCCLCTPSTGQVTRIPVSVAYVIQAMPQTPLVPAATSNAHGLFSLKP